MSFCWLNEAKDIVVLDMEFRIERDEQGGLTWVRGARQITLPPEINMPWFLKSTPDECMSAVRAACR